MAGTRGLAAHRVQPADVRVGGVLPAQLRLAQQAWAKGEAIDPAAALPTYVRDKVAQTTAERLAGKVPRQAA